MALSKEEILDAISEMSSFVGKFVYYNPRD
jgi:hypothetical protein